MTERSWGPSFGPTDLELGTNPLAICREFVRLVATGRADAASVRAHQRRRASVLAEQVQRTVPMYAGSTGTPFDALPTIDRRHVRGFSLDERSAGPEPPGSRRVLTTGSTGEPLTVLYPPGFARWQAVLRARTDLYRGTPPWARRVVLAFSPDSRPTRGWTGRVRNRTLTLPSSGPTIELVPAILAARPRTLGGLPHVLLDVGEHLPADFRVRSVNPLGETLDDLLRDALARRYGHRPLDTYGTAEVGNIAWQCRAGDLYHVNHESVLLEVLDADERPVSPGGTGTAVTTTLGNPLMPFLRYRTDDLVTVADRPCACGNKLPALLSVDGRTMDWIMADGRRIAPERFWLSLHMDLSLCTTLVRRYRVHQEASGRLQVHMILEGPAPEGLIDSVAASYQQLVGATTPVDVRVVEDLPLGPAGKFQLIGSDVTSATVDPS